MDKKITVQIFFQLFLTFFEDFAIFLKNRLLYLYILYIRGYTKFVPSQKITTFAPNNTTMNWKKISILLAALIIADQVLKIWIKTSFHLGESLTVFSDWFKLYFVENNGAAFGMQISSASAFDWGKLLLSLFRVGLVGMMFWYINTLIKKGAPKGVIVGLVLIIAGAIGNIIDSAFYGLIFSASTPATVAHLGDGYAPFMMGRVVDMFYFPLFQWNNCPEWLSFLVDSQNYFFGAIFNLADAYISVAVVYLLIFQYKFFK